MQEPSHRLVFLPSFIAWVARDGGNLAAGFVGVEAVVADGLLAFGWDVEKSGGDEIGGFEYLEVALGGLVAWWLGGVVVWWCGGGVWSGR